MTIPKNPDTIVIKNKYYPKGLKEIDIWNYYMNIKQKLLKELKDRNVMMGIMVDINKMILRRNIDNRPIRINNKNYNILMGGRNVVFYPEMKHYENFCIIDIDISKHDNFIWALEATKNIYDYIIDSFTLVSNVDIKFTGKYSFHLICHFHKRMKIDVIKFLIEQQLRKSKLSKVYTINYKRTPGIPNIDLSPNKYRGNYIALHSLSSLGLKSVLVPYEKLMSFRPEMAKIK